MKYSFSSEQLRGFSEFVSNSFLRAPAHMMALDLSRNALMSRGYGQLAFFEPLLIWSQPHSSDSYFFFFFFFLYFFF